MIAGVGTFAMRLKLLRFEPSIDGGDVRDLAVYQGAPAIARARLTSIAIPPCPHVELRTARVGVFWLLDGREPIPLTTGLRWELPDPMASAVRISPAVGLTIILRARQRGARPPCVVAWFDAKEQRDYFGPPEGFR